VELLHSSEQSVRRLGFPRFVDPHSYPFLESRLTFGSRSLSAFHNRLYAPEVLLQGRSPETHPDLAIPQVAEYRSRLVCICSVDCLSFMIPLPGHGPEYLIHFFSVLAVVIGLKSGDLAGKFGFDNGYCYLPPVCDVQS
jgi:hypothetical protein